LQTKENAKEIKPIKLKIPNNIDEYENDKK